MGEPLRWVCIAAASALTLVGFFAFVHDYLMIAGLAKPLGDGPRWSHRRATFRGRWRLADPEGNQDDPFRNDQVTRSAPDGR